MNIGVIGLGIIGSRMARNWQQAGQRVRGWNRTREHAQGLGLALSGTPAELAAQSDLVMIVVADPPALAAVVSGPDGVAAVPLKGKVVLNASTVGPDDNRAADAAVRAAGGEFLETPFTGSKAGAEAAKLIFYVGGEAALLQRVTPQLRQIGAQFFHFGPVGAAADAKLVMNMMLASTMEAMAEGFAFAARSGLDLKTFVEAYRLNAGWSPLAEMKVPKLLAQDFSPHFSLKHMDKDLRLFVERARQLNLPLIQARHLKDIFSAAMAQGWGDEDFSVLHRQVAQAAAAPQGR